MFREEVTFLSGGAADSRERAAAPGAKPSSLTGISAPRGRALLRGAWNFQTPPGWDTVYTPIFNSIERPVAPMLVVRVETDWYAHENEFRYVLQPGEGMSGAHHLPIGQVFFVPREEITLRDCREEELARDPSIARRNSPRDKAVGGDHHLGTDFRSTRAISAQAVCRMHQKVETAHDVTTTAKPVQEPVPARELRPPVLQRSDAEVVPVARAPSTSKVGRNGSLPMRQRKEIQEVSR